MVRIGVKYTITCPLLHFASCRPLKTAPEEVSTLVLGTVEMTVQTLLVETVLRFGLGQFWDRVFSWPSERSRPVSVCVSRTWLHRVAQACF